MVRVDFVGPERTDDSLERGKSQRCDVAGDVVGELQVDAALERVERNVVGLVAGGGGGSGGGGARRDGLVVEVGRDVGAVEASLAVGEVDAVGFEVVVEGVDAGAVPVGDRGAGEVLEIAVFWQYRV